MKHSTAEDELKKSDLLFQPALANISKNGASSPKLKQICSICNLEVEGGKFFEHLATAHSDSKESPTKPEKLSSKVTANPMNIIETVVAAASLKLINQGKNPTANPIGLVFNKESPHQKPLTLEEKIEVFNIKPCEIKLTKCDDLINQQVQHKTTPENNSKIQEKVTPKKSKGKTDSAGQILKLHLCSYPKCEKYFRSNYELEIHSHVHSGEKPYKCKVCFRRFSRKSSLNRHSIMHIDESNRKLHKCSFLGCNKAFGAPSQLQVHYRIHTGEKPFQCKVCLKRFNQSYSLTVHSRIHTGDKPFQCNTCFKRFTQSYTLTLHVKMVHGNSTSRASVRKMQKENKSLSKNMASIKGAINSSSEPQKKISSSKVKSSKGQAHPAQLGTARSDSKTKRPATPEQLNSVVTATPKNITEPDTAPTAVSLKLINKRNYSNVTALSFEEKIKAFNIKPCEVKLTKCDYLINRADYPTISHKTNSKIQEKVTEDKSKRKTDSESQIPKLQCSYTGCAKLFKNTTSLRVHYRIHTGEKPFQCRVCLKRFNQSSYLTVHQRIHTGDKPFKCKVCLKRFTQSCSLSTHARIHTDGQTSFNRTSKLHHRQSLSRLGKTVSNRKLHKCSFPGCNKTFRAPNQLQAHYRIHTGEKPFQCKVCLKRFNQSSYLTVHSRIHTGDKPFQCKTCFKRFTQSGSLIKHVKNVHGKRNSGTSVRKVQKESRSLSRKSSSKNRMNPSSEPQKKISTSKVKSSKGQTQLVKKTKPLGKATLSLQTPKENVFACLGCSKRDTNLSNLELHIKQAHGLELGANFDRTLLRCKTSN